MVDASPGPSQTVGTLRLGEAAHPVMHGSNRGTQCKPAITTHTQQRPQTCQCLTSALALTFCQLYNKLVCTTSPCVLCVRGTQQSLLG